MLFVLLFVIVFICYPIVVCYRVPYLMGDKQAIEPLVTTLFWEVKIGKYLLWRRSVKKIVRDLKKPCIVVLEVAK